MVLPEAMLRTMGWAAIRVHVGVLSLCCCWSLWWCLWSVLLQRTMLMSVVCTATGDSVEGHGMCWCQRSCECPWSMLSPKAMWKFVIQALADCKGKKNPAFAMLSMTIDSVEKQGHKKLFNILINKCLPIPTEVYSTAHLGICSNKLEEEEGHPRPKVWRATLKHWSPWWWWKAYCSILFKLGHFVKSCLSNLDQESRVLVFKSPDKVASVTLRATHLSLSFLPGLPCSQLVSSQFFPSPVFFYLVTFIQTTLTTKLGHTCVFNHFCAFKSFSLSRPACP